MNKSALKNFATEARIELLEKVELQARKIGITAESIQEANVESSDAVFIDGKQLSDIERRQRNKLIARINEIGFERVMEETAYTWFNRFIALRYMEVNDYLPTKVRVLSSESGSAEPDMMKEALTLNLDLDKEKVYEMKMNNETDELFKYLIKMHCNDLNRYMPFMFETIEDYTEILFPEGLLGTDSFVRKMTDTEVIPESNWKKVEIIGWLYQYYISDEKDRVIMAKKKYKQNEIPFATQLFTPEWIVRYMVQNTLGRYWIESHPEHRDLIKNWEFYLESQQPEDNYEEKLAPYTNKELNVEEIKCFDPAMGSGHILVYMFDVLYEIYSKCGYIEREIPRLIIENNIYGLDIDDRAFQLASFSVVMKALEYNKRFLRIIERDGLSMNLASVQDTNDLSDEDIAYFAGEERGKDFESTKDFFDQFHNAKVTGSLIRLEKYDKQFIADRLSEIENSSSHDLFEYEKRERIVELIEKVKFQADIMVQKYDVFITNPPYMGSRYMTPELTGYLRKNYMSYTDLFSVFIEYSFERTKKNGQIGLLTPFVWMFLSSYEDIRKKIVAEKSISSLIQLEYNAFGAAVVPVCTFTMRNYQANLSGEYIRLSDFTGVENQPTKTLEAINNPCVTYRYSFNQNKLDVIPGRPIAYWIPEKLAEVFMTQEELLEYIDVTGSQNITANNERFLRRIWEVRSQDIGEKWVLYTKGGNYRKWYGNMDYVVDWSDEAIEYYKNNKSSNLLNEKYWFRDGLTYNGISNKGFSVRIARNAIYDKKGPTFHIKNKELESYFIGLLNTKAIDFIMNMYNPTMSIQMRDVNNLPVIIPDDEELISNVKSLANSSIEVSKFDWDSAETSLDFKNHPFLNSDVRTEKIADTYANWEKYSYENIERLSINETELNRIFINLYGLEDILDPTVSNEEVTIGRAEKEIDIKSFISYAIGCSFGRYSLDEKGIIFTGGEFDQARYQIFPADEDNILPVLPGAYFEDDIVTRFVDFVRVTFSEETLEENLDFVADAIGRRKNETARETLRRYFLNDFYKDHVKVYKKRPIYWLFSSGKEKAFNCLIYMHRYDKTTLSRIRTDYLHEVQTRMDAEKNDLLEIINGDYTTREINSAKRELKALDRKIDELKKYDEVLHHMADMQIEIDLDDGVKVNYEKFKGLVAKI